jgi:dihydrofolate synthase/folylpolyglutamate synthase
MPVSPALTLNNRPAGRIRPELESLREVLASRGNPQLAYPSVLIVGTNGKGSTAAMLEAVFRAHRIRTGLFTSPHLVRVEERVRLDGVPVDERILARAIGRFDDSPDLTYFETLAAAAFEVFRDSKVDVAVLEAGMGGSWDATRLADSAIAGLTNIGSDHAAWLGAERKAVARDKGRALAAAERAVIGSGVDDLILPAIDAPLAQPARHLVTVDDAAGGRVSVQWEGARISVEMPLAGAFQIANLELALALAVEASAVDWMPSLDPDGLRPALERVTWPGRLSVHRVGGRELLVDCAHNLEAATALACHLEELDSRFNLLFSCLDDKPVEAMADVLRPHVGDVVVCPLDDERAMPLSRLAAAFPDAEVADDIQRALLRLDDPIVAAGSIRLVGALLALEEKDSVG